MKNLTAHKPVMAALLGVVLSFTASLTNAATAKPTGWFIRVIAEAPTEKLSDPGNVLGLMSDSVNTYDSHDLEELPPFGTPYLTAVFPHQNWLKKGDYTTDFQKLDKAIHQWNFEVRTDDIKRKVILRWEGDAAKLKKSTLKDVKTGKTYNIALTKNLTFTMGSTVRSFVWRVLP